MCRERDREGDRDRNKETAGQRKNFSVGQSKDKKTHYPLEMRRTEVIDEPQMISQAC